jgi:Uma2 family endonuclease
MSHRTQRSRHARLVYEVAASRDEWFLSEDKVPESRPHDRASEAVLAQLDAMVARTRRDAIVCRNLAIRWDEDRPGIGVDPDVCLIEPAPPEGEDLFSLLLWQTGHYPPLLAVEIVSTSRPGKGYSQSPEKYAANGTKELWVFDPRLAGPKAMNGPFRLQVWRRDENDDFRRVYAGEGPAWSEALGAWAFAVNEGRSLRIADDEAGTSWWMTREEAERAAKEAERKEKEAERKEKEEAQLRVERLAARLRELGIDPGSIH